MTTALDRPSAELRSERRTRYTTSSVKREPGKVSNRVKLKARNEAFWLRKPVAKPAEDEEEDTKQIWSHEAWFSPDSLVRTISGKQKALNKETREKGAKHPETLKSKLALAELYEELGNFRISSMLYRSVYRVNLESLGENDPHTLSSMSLLANSLHGLGDLDGAVRIQRKLVRMKGDAYGTQNENTISSMTDLACSLKDRGDIEGSMNVCAQIYRRQLEVLGSSHEDTIAARDSLAYCVKEYTKGKGLTKVQAMQILMESFGEPMAGKELSEIIWQLRPREKSKYVYSQGKAPLPEGMNKTAIEELVQKRYTARGKLNFKAADRLEYALRDMGVYINDRTKTWNVPSTFRYRERGKERWTPYRMGSGSLRDGLTKIEIDAKMEERLEAKYKRDFDAADAIEKELWDMGIRVDDRKRVWHILAPGKKS